MCAGKALNNNSTVIRDALFKFFVESALSDSSKQCREQSHRFCLRRIIHCASCEKPLQADSYKLFLETASNPVKACVWEMMVLFNLRSCTFRPRGRCSGSCGRCGCLCPCRSCGSHCSSGPVPAPCKRPSGRLLHRLSLEARSKFEE